MLGDGHQLVANTQQLQVSAGQMLIQPHSDARILINTLFVSTAYSAVFLQNTNFFVLVKILISGHEVNVR